MFADDRRRSKRPADVSSESATAKELAPEVLALARRKRRELLREYGDLRGQCHNWASETAVELARLGIRSRVVTGWFKVDRIIDNPLVEPTLFQIHHWVEIDGAIIDGTASQFQDLCDGKIPTMVVVPVTGASRHLAWSMRVVAGQ